MTKPYDRNYFDRHYRSRDSRIESDADLGRRVRMVVSIAEHVLGRPIRNVLDVGCGEARWHPHLRKIRNAIAYIGIDPSDYVVQRFGRSRNVILGDIDDVENLVTGRFDLIVCADVLHYLSAKKVERSLETLTRLGRGVLFVDVTTREDDPEGDLDGWHSRGAAWYRRRFERAGLVHCGMQCWAVDEVAERVSSMESG